ncbi:MAG: superoxide dismutase family protein [Mangrovimonas sp.]|nr:superoxide dismutase family protein [Mangrovimonas sp.]HPF97154.1 superoxide dismutase family protein [Mangrovimonas sp.]
MKTKILLGLLIISFIACKNDKKKAETEEIVTEEPAAAAMPEVKKVTVEMGSKSGSEANGTVVFKQEGNTVTMTALISNLTEGQHAIHIHEKADCSADDGTSTGGHWNPTAQPHGKWGDPNGYHKGDIGNLTADANGNATLTFSTDEWCIGCGDPKKDILGKGLIVHEGADDFVTQPTGNAGGRISCGGIIE